MCVTVRLVAYNGPANVYSGVSDGYDVAQKLPSIAWRSASCARLKQRLAQAAGLSSLKASAGAPEVSKYAGTAVVDKVTHQFKIIPEAARRSWVSLISRSQVS